MLGQNQNWKDLEVEEILQNLRIKGDEDDDVYGCGCPNCFRFPTEKEIKELRKELHLCYDCATIGNLRCFDQLEKKC